MTKELTYKSWTNDKESHAEMKIRQTLSRAEAIINEDQIWVEERLKSTKLSWTMQSIWGYRLFDFWCFKLGIVIEVGQSEHGKDYDLKSDQYEYARSGIRVIRVRALNEEDMKLAIEEILKSETWNERRAVLKLKPIYGN